MSIVSEAFFFPLKNTSLKMYFGLVVLYLLQFCMSYVPVFGILTFLFIGYIYATQFKIIFTTGNGYADAPEFPDFGELFDNVLIPLLKVILVSIISFSPYLLYVISTGVPEEWLELLLLLLAFCYMPLGLMIVAMDETMQLFNPVVLLNAIRSAGVAYIAMVLAYGGLSILTSILEEAFAGSWILGSALGAYGILFNGRLIGGVYRDRLAHQEFDVDKED